MPWKLNECQSQPYNFMKKNANHVLAAKDKGEIISCRPPLVFSIPRPYEDDYDRNNNWYPQILKLEKKSQQLKEKLREIADRQALNHYITTQLIQKSVELNKR